MSMDQNVIVMVGYDISNLSGYIKNLENANDGEFVDGIPKYSLNFTDNKIGYDQATKSMFGKVIFDLEDADEDKPFVIALGHFENMRSEIWEKYKLFLFDHTKITDKTEPPFVLKIITWYS